MTASVPPEGLSPNAPTDAGRGAGEAHLTLFNHPAYHAMNMRAGQRLFRYDHWENTRLVGTLTGMVDQGVVDCGYSAPYGGPDLVRSGESAGIVRGFLEGAIATARREGARAIRVRARPEFHSRNEAVVLFSLFNLGFAVERCELTQGIDLGGLNSSEEYVAHLKSSHRRELRHGLDALEFHQAETADAWAAAYQVIAVNRRHRGLQLKISLEYVLRLRDIFSPRIRMYQLSTEGTLIAAALVYRVRSDCDYVVAWGDDRTRRDLAPINVLAYRLVEHAFAERVRLVDIGISSVDGIPDDGLIEFKRHILATSGLRLDLMREL